MNLLRSRIHHLIDLIADEELEQTWGTLEAMYQDFYMLRAVQEAKHTLKPGDALTYEEAIQFLYSI